jgi:HTH-type transcriptional regulator/antitoxin HigA
MKTLKYKIIKSSRQYADYCSELETLVSAKSKTKEVNDEIELLTLLIEKWDSEHSSFMDHDPVTILASLMRQRNMKAVNLAELLGVSKGLVSDILHYKKGLSKDIIRHLSTEFKVSQEAFNRSYILKNASGSHLLRTRAMNPRKEPEFA